MQKLCKECRDPQSKSDRIVFNQALRMIGPNMELEEPLLKEWVIVSGQAVGQMSTTDSRSITTTTSMANLGQAGAAMSTNKVLKTLNTEYKSNQQVINNLTSKLQAENKLEATNQGHDIVEAPQHASPSPPPPQAKRGRSPQAQPH